MDVHKEIASVVGLLQSLVSIAQHDGHPCALMDAAKVAEDAVWSALRRVENRRSLLVGKENAGRAPAYLLLLNVEGVLGTALAACYSLRHEGEVDAGLATIETSGATPNELSSCDAREDLQRVISELRNLEQRVRVLQQGKSPGAGRPPEEIPQDIVSALEREGVPTGIAKLRDIVRSVRPDFSDKQITTIQKAVIRRKKKGQDLQSGRKIDD